jgi:RHS repeat-associated protein
VTHAYHYTPLNQLCYAGSTSTAVCTAPPTGSQLYTYDTADNLVRNMATTQSYNAADELCWSVTGTSTNTCATPPTGATGYSYDTRGNRTKITPPSGPATTLGYDQADRLVSYTQGYPSATYAYNGDGLRMTKTVGPTTTPFVWDGESGLPLMLSDSTNSYVYGPVGLPLEQITGTTPLWLHHDQLGSTRLLTNTTGTKVATYTYTPYGTLASTTGTAVTPLRFTGEYQDSESGLYYLRARYYDPATAQFATVDPAVAGTGQPYAYALDNPINTRDQSGLWWCWPPWGSNCDVPIADAFVSSDPGKFANGWANGVTLGGSSAVESVTTNGQANVAVDQCSSAYTVGEVAGATTFVALSAGAGGGELASKGIDVAKTSLGLSGVELGPAGEAASTIFDAARTLWQGREAIPGALKQIVVGLASLKYVR